MMWNLKSFQRFTEFVAFLLNAQIFFKYFYRDRLFEWKHMRYAQKQEHPRQGKRVVDANFLLLIWNNKRDEWKAKSRSL